MQALPALPESLCIVQMGEVGDSEVGVTSVGGFFLNIGLQNGVLLRTALDGVTGDLADTRTRYVTITCGFIIIVFLHNWWFIIIVFLHNLWFYHYCFS